MRKIKKTSYLLVYIILVLSYFDTVLRFSFNDNLSPFRIVIALFALVLIFNSGKEYLKYHLFMILIAIYSILVILLWHGSFFMFINHYVHWLFVYFIFLSLLFLAEDCDFEIQCFRFIDRMTIFVTIVFYFEYFFGIRLFQDKLALYDLPSSLFYGINDFASVIVVGGVLYALIFVYERKIIYLFKYLIIFGAVTIVGARASILSLAGTLVIAILLKVCTRLEHTFCKRFFIFICAGVIGVILLFIINPTVGDASLSELLIAPISQIRHLEVSSFQGSVTVRTSAMVIGIKEIINSYGFGIGLGNATYVLSSYGFSTLKSMHNMLMQLLTEMGWFAFIFFFCLLKKAIKCYRLQSESNMPTYCFIFFLLTPLFAIQSSEGLMSIYPFWIVYFYVFICAFSPQKHQSKDKDIQKIE